MVSYATISKIRGYAMDDYYVLFPQSRADRLWEKLKCIVKIAFGRGLVRYYKGNSLNRLFVQGTRGWEYPWALEQLSGLEKDSKILDCGCGVSFFPLELFYRGFDVTGLDRFLDESAMSFVFGRYSGGIYNKVLRRGPVWGIPKRVRTKLAGKVKYVNGAMDNISLPDNTFDAVTCLSVMEHIVLETGDNPAYHFRCLNEMKRVLKPGGLLILTYDIVLEDSKRFWAGREGWGSRGWHYLTDIEYTGMQLKDLNSKIPDKADINKDPDTYIIPPEVYYDGYGKHQYERITSLGFVLVKDH